MREFARLGTVISLSLAAFGCVRGPDVSSPELPLRRVVVYRNGVGYFERAGEASGEQVSFKMRQRMVGDFLATLAIVERGGSSLRSASFPLEVEDDAEATVAQDARFQRLLQAWQRPGEPPLPPTKTEDRLRKVVLSLDGKKHDLAVGYVAATPLWRPSYRVVVGEGGADLQVWGIVQNLSGEDWKNVELTLVAGAPIAFESTLGTPVTPTRPVITDTGEIISQVPEGMTSLGARADGGVDRYAPEESDPEADATAEEASAAQYAPGASRASEAKKDEAGRGRLVNAAKAAPPAPPSPVARVRLDDQGLSAPRRLSALAAVAVGGGSTRYRIPGEVSVPDESATMVLLLSQKVPGESVFLFAPDGGVPDSSSHPFRVARFENATPGLLERGPIAVFGQGQFLGQGMLEPLPPKGKATVPFALDRSVAVSSERLSTEQGARLFSIEAGALYVERDSVTKTTYKIVSGSDEASKLLVRHPRLSAARLYKPPAGTEDDEAAGFALVPVPLKPRGRAELVVEERQALQQGLDWLHPLADEAVKAYRADSRADRQTAQRLGEAWVLREGLRRATDEQLALEAEQRELEKSSRETRLSLEAIEKNAQAADLRLKLTKRLAEVTSRLEQITKRLIEVRLSQGEAQVRFKEAIREIKLLAPLPPKE